MKLTEISSRQKAWRIRVPGEGKMPTRIGIIGHVTEIAHEGDLPAQLPLNANLESNLRSASFVHYRLENSKCTRVKNATSGNAEAFWYQLYDLTRGGGTHTFFTHDAWQLWGAVRGTVEIERGNLIVADQGYRPEGKNGKPIGRRLSGLIVGENPPTIIIARMRQGGIIKLIDIGNYGLVVPGELLHDPASSMRWVSYTVLEMIRFLSANKLGALQLTAASQAWYTFRKCCMSEPLWPTIYAEPLKLERDSLFGGRCECFRIGKICSQVFHYDIKSCYPTVLQTYNSPSKLRGYEENTPVGKLHAKMRQLCCVADVDLVNVDKTIFPCRKDGLTVFPTGNFRTCLHHFELAKALLHGQVATVHRAAWYETSGVLLNWSNLMLGLRARIGTDADVRIGPFIKRMTNALYGRFGYRPKTWETVEWPEHDTGWLQWYTAGAEDGKPIKWRSMDGVVQREVEVAETATSMPVVSGYVNHLGRFILNGIIECAGVDNVHYCDTDSVMTNADGASRLNAAGYVHADANGYLRLREQSCDVELFGIKRYRFGKRWCWAGSDVKPVNPDEGRCGYLEVESLDNGLFHGRAGEGVLVHRALGRAGKYRHGIVKTDGAVVPFNLH